MRKMNSIALAVLAAAILVGCHKKAANLNVDDGPIPVAVAPVVSQDMPIYLDGLGSVQAFNSATLRAQVSGLLLKVPFKEGDEVKAGSIVAQIDPRPYQAQLDEAIGTRGQHEAQLINAQADLKRYTDLQPQGYVTGQQVDQQKATVAQYKAAVATDDATIENARVSLGYCTIRAPFDGVVGIRQVDVGNLVSASDTTGIVVLTQIKPISVTFTLPEQALKEIRNVDTNTLKVEALDRDNATLLAVGKLLAVDNQIDQSTGTIKLKAVFDNKNRALWPGQFVNARLLVRIQKDGLTIPAQAVQRGPAGDFVYITKPDNTVTMAPVKVQQNEAGLALIDSGLKVGDIVVIDGQYRLQDGSKIAVSTPVSASSSAPAPVGVASSSGAP